MKSFDETFSEEERHLDKVIKIIGEKISALKEHIKVMRDRLSELQKELWENGAHAAEDVDSLFGLNQNLLEFKLKAASYVEEKSTLSKLEKMKKSPYFARIDFKEDGSSDVERIYIGISGLNDDKTYYPYVYDWRAPISSMFYRFETGRAWYIAPMGKISGEITLKRQYEIENGKLISFFDSSLTVTDEILRRILSQNASEKMRSIVETIQREQDKVIRDTENEILIVQGAAGSGKTSVALHRAAYLMYQGLENRINANNIIIISPSELFSQYISAVLPELGEENIKTHTFEELYELIFNSPISESRDESHEKILTSPPDEAKFLRDCRSFKLSGAFSQILDRFLYYYEHKLIKFEDVYFDGKTVFSSQELKALLLADKINMPLQKRLERIENRILETLHPLRRKRLQKIEKVVEEHIDRQFEIKPFSRLLSIKQSLRFTNRLRKITRLDYIEMYRRLFRDKNLFFSLAKGLNLPRNIDEILSRTAYAEHFSHEDCMALLYLKLKCESCKAFFDIRQVIVDEAQDYGPLHYGILNLLFRGARYTITGDVHQSVNSLGGMEIYSEIAKIFGKKKSAMLLLGKSYRSSFEITRFSEKILGGVVQIEAFMRHEKEPEVLKMTKLDVLASKIREYENEGFRSIAVICKTQAEAQRLKCQAAPLIRLNKENAQILPVYAAKGLEFDAVIVVGADEANYDDEYDRRLLYIACTRALHRLCVFYSEKKSRFLP